jgi:hypothetical protein
MHRYAWIFIDTHGYSWISMLISMDMWISTVSKDIHKKSWISTVNIHMDMDMPFPDTVDIHIHG